MHHYYNPLYYVVFGLIALTLGWLLLGVFFSS